MIMYKFITLKSGEVFACNRDGEGVFQKRFDGTWIQHRGTSQTPVFTTPAAFSRYLHANVRDSQGEKLSRMSNSYGW